MADTQKPADVPQETPATEPVAETKPAEGAVVETPAAATTDAAAAPAAEAAPAAAEGNATAEGAAATEEAKKEEDAKEEAKDESKKDEEVKPIEEGYLEHKGQGANFPKYVIARHCKESANGPNLARRNFIYSKQFFWFGSEPVELKSVASFKADKVADVAHHVIAWAAETGKGLLFFSEKADKAAPSGAIQLVCEATFSPARCRADARFPGRGLRACH